MIEMETIGDAGLIHLSGSMLALLSGKADASLWDVISEACTKGARLSLDPNVRPSLWASLDQARVTLNPFLRADGHCPAEFR
ncbi:MAG: hypothetical protein AAFQ60_06360 [Pseudomonadota bacterium]